ncbi:MAG: T9SS C-terminal target domain-containing protein, partial [Bacteroidetes bacterium]
SLLIALCSLFSLATFAQSATYKGATLDKKVASQPMKMNKVAMTGFEDTPVHVNPNLPTNRTEPAQSIGSTLYDLQTNSAVQNRIIDHNGTNLSATWTFGTDAAAGYPNRGTGFNANDGTSWGPEPSTRVEANVRTGWPAHGGLADGTPVILAHTSNSTLHLSKWHAPSGTWIETDIPSNVPGGLLWPRMAVAGPDGNTIHAIAITTPVGNGGQMYNDVDGHLLYFRSTDGGTTWDKVDVTIPGMDKTKFTSMSADSYSIDASGETVAIGLWSDLGDVLVAKSSDNGETWVTNVLRDFPIDQYAIDQGWTEADVTLKDTLGGPTGVLAIQTSDGTGDVLVDRNGLVHAWYGEMFYVDDDLTDGSFSFYPLWSGVRYWNETYGQDSTNVVAGLVDADGNGTYDLQNTNIAVAGNYFTSITSFISAAVDMENNLYVAYAALTEDNWKDDANPELQHYHHIFVTNSQDGGETWLDTPLDVIAPGLVDDDDLIPAMEAVFPSLARDVRGDFLHMTYQLDFEPGLSVRGDSDPAETNFIYHLALDLAEFGIVGTEEVVRPETFQLNLAPNPASGNVRLSYELPESAQTTISIVNMMGQEVMRESLGNQFAGVYTHQLNLDNIANGVYMVRFQADNQISTQKLIVK